MLLTTLAAAPAHAQSEPEDDHNEELAVCTTTTQFYAELFEDYIPWEHIEENPIDNLTNADQSDYVFVQD